MQIKPDRPAVELGVTEAARRNQIIEATIDVMAEFGYHQTSYARIVHKAGLSSNRIISYHLGSKADLLQAVLLAIIDTKDHFLEQRAGNPGDRHEIIRSYIEAEVAFLGAYPRHVRALHEFGSHAPKDPSGDSPLPGLLFQEVRVGRLARQLSQGQRDGSFGDFDVAIMADSIARAIEGADEALAANPELNLDHYGRELANLFTKALSVDKTAQTK